jgi:hypothetical protein
MSGVGISPSDIIRGLRVAHKAVSALRTNEGARSHYQHAKQSHDDLKEAVNALAQTCSASGVSSTPALQQTIDHVLKNHKWQETQLQKYECALGEGSPKQKRHGIVWKIRWAFHEDQEVRDFDNKTRPAIDAAILQTLQ